MPDLDPRLEPVTTPAQTPPDPRLEALPPVAPEPTAQLEPVPQAYQDRVAHGEAITQALQDHGKRSVLDKLFGINGPRDQLWPERLVRSGVTLAGDVMDGTVISGAGLRKEDFSDDPDAPEPLETLIERSADMASLVLGGTSFGRLAGSAAPVVTSKGGVPTRLTADAEGTMRGQGIGPTPNNQDFTTAAQVIGGPEAEANLRTLWKEKGIHPAEAAFDYQADAWARHNIATNPDRGATSDLAKTGDPLVDSILADPETKAAIDNPRVNRSNIVPYSAGPDRTGAGLNIDRNFPAQMTVDGITFNTHEPLGVHEFVERDGMNKLIKGGMDPDAAYRFAHSKLADPAENAWYTAHGLDPKKVNEAYQPYIDAIDHENVNETPPDLFGKPYPHGNVHLAGEGPVEASEPSPAEIAQATEILNRKPQPLGAAANTDPPLVPLNEQPAPPNGKLVTAAQDAIAKANSIGKNIQMLVFPMSTGSDFAMAAVKDAMNAQRRSRWEGAREDKDLTGNFTPEQRTRMWEAGDEESVLRQEGKTNEHTGLATLTPAERIKVQALQNRQAVMFSKAKDIGMFKGEGIPSYMPRVMVNMLDRLAGKKPVALTGKSGIRTSSTTLMQRKYLTAEETEAAGKEVLGGGQLVRDVRILPMKTTELEHAIIGRTLINQIEEHGASTGFPTVVHGNLPSAVNPKDWFTIPENPSFYSWEPMVAKDKNGMPAFTNGVRTFIKDEEGNQLFERTPIHVHRDFEGPLRSMMEKPSGELYKGLMAIKGKSMSLILNSPLIHNLVEFSRAFPSMPGKMVTLRAYFEGNLAKNNPGVMREFIDNGLVPIGPRFFNQDITSIMENPDLTPGRSWTAKVLGLFDKGAENTVKNAVDKAGDFWHNTLLWDRIADLQMGIAVNFQRDAIARGHDRQTATRYAAYFANRLAGSLPQEAMSKGARQVANFLTFSRTLTLGDVGAAKDMFTGLSKDVSAQIKRDAGPEALAAIKSLARRKAVVIAATGFGLSIIGGSILQNAFNVMLNDSSVPAEFQGYIKRLQQIGEDIHQHPLQSLLPWNALSEARKISATSENEPGKQDHIRLGTAADGTGIYATNPMGHATGNQLADYLTGPLDTIKRKLGTFAKPALDIFSNDRGFGRKVYDPNALENGTELQAAIDLAIEFAEAQAPTGQLRAFGKLVTGSDDAKFDALQAFSPFLGTSTSKGAPGGPGVGDYYHAKEMQQFQIERQTQDIRDLIRKGDMAGAREKMDALGMDKSYQKWMIKTSQNPSLRLNPKTLRELYQFLTPEQREQIMGGGK